ncbi:uncharacterized protein K441DRAFT_654729 [Cenococcum geophilum 1.58]|uniref:uncharacterized protein n=1 Tax=Cenococcum geophilum 1.58 TaxID=794803 RepID=UPI00358F96EC|nr:hypothetical protein K441DRAFT_654729 [Cenococcum geophilum 1.58]
MYGTSDILVDFHDVEEIEQLEPLLPSSLDGDQHIERRHPILALSERNENFKPFVRDVRLPPRNCRKVMYPCWPGENLKPSPTEKKEITKWWQIIWGRGLSRARRYIHTANKVIIKGSGSSHDDPQGGREDYKIDREPIKFTKKELKLTQAIS